VDDVNLITAGRLQCEVQRVGHVFSLHVGAKPPGDDVAAVARWSARYAPHLGEDASVRFSPIVNLLCCSQSHQRNGIKPPQGQRQTLGEARLLLCWAAFSILKTVGITEKGQSTT
jgi:hypothetical protein